MRLDHRAPAAWREPSIQRGLQAYPEGSVLYTCGGTRVLVAASIEPGVPGFLEGKKRGWLTAEYAMHPRANPTRQSRDGRKGRVDGRSQEIQRLIGRALRATLNFDALGERTITIDCDVLNADGGTRTASVTAGFIGLALALDALHREETMSQPPLQSMAAAISVGLVKGQILVDLDYQEDSQASFDLNVVGTQQGELIEVQGTAEEGPVARAQVDTMIDQALNAIQQLTQFQRQCLQQAEVDLQHLLAPSA